MQDVEAVRVEDVAELILEPENETDPEAIRVDIGGKKMGYINRVVNTNVHGWLEHAVVTAKVCKKNGTPERPLIYIAITAQPK